MSTARPFAYNLGTPISGTIQVGDLAIGTPTTGFTNNPQFWEGPDEELGYVIAHPNITGGQPNPLFIPAYVGFNRTQTFNDNDFIDLAEYVANEFATPQTFSSATDASIWLTNNGYWNSYPAPVLYLDAGNTSSYPGSGTIWTDIIGGKTFNLINGPTYDSGNDGKIYFSASAGQYAGCSSNLPDLSAWSVGVWHYYTGQNVGIGMCLVTEVYPGNTFNINYALGDDNGNANGALSSGFFDGGWRTTNNYTLTPNNWYYIVGTYDGYTNNLYVNNTLVESSNYVGTPISSQGGINLMRRWDNPDFWDGYLSVVGIYDKALTSSQISSIWYAQKDRYLGPILSPTPTATPTGTPSVTTTPTPTGTPSVTTTPTTTPTPTSTPSVPSGSGYNFFVAEGSSALPPSSSGNTEFFYQAGVLATYNPNYIGGNGSFQLYFNRYASDGTDNITAMQGLDTTGGTITMTQGSNTVTYSGVSTDYTYDTPNNWFYLTVTGSSQQTIISGGNFVSGTPINVLFGTPAPSPTPTATSVTPTPTPTNVTGYGYNLVALPYNFPSSGNSIMNEPVLNVSGGTNPNLLATSGIGFYINSIDNVSANRTNYYSSFTGQSVTITLSQAGSTAIYSGDTGSFKYWASGSDTGFVFGTQIGVPPSGVPSGNAVLIQSASTQWTIGLPVYVSLVTN